jgi:hypothetical protein
MSLFGPSLLLIPALLGAPAFGEVDFAGQWAPLFHEDNPEPLPGPELGDYMGIPSTKPPVCSADSYDADRISVVTEYQCRPHGGDYARPVEYENRFHYRSRHAKADRDPHADEFSGDETYDLDGWAAASSGHGASHGFRVSPPPPGMATC